MPSLRPFSLQPPWLAERASERHHQCPQLLPPLHAAGCREGRAPSARRGRAGEQHRCVSHASHPCHLHSRSHHFWSLALQPLLLLPSQQQEACRDHARCLLAGEQWNDWRREGTRRPLSWEEQLQEQSPQRQEQAQSQEERHRRLEMLPELKRSC